MSTWPFLIDEDFDWCCAQIWLFPHVKRRHLPQIARRRRGLTPRDGNWRSRHTPRMWPERGEGVVQPESLMCATSWIDRPV